MANTDAIRIVEGLGKDTIQATFNVGEKSIAAFRLNGFSGRYFKELSAMCEDRGVPCPYEAFKWKERVNV